MNIIEAKAYEVIPERRFDTPHGNLDINSGYRDRWIQGYREGVKETLEIIKLFVEKRANSYVNGEYNEFHHGIDYDGTINKDSMIKDIEKEIKDYFNQKI